MFFLEPTFHVILYHLFHVTLALENFRINIPYLLIYLLNISEGKIFEIALKIEI